uniref:Uncharacterized protein n=1 Tax=Setaria viridis TaxID=4556 RepID=A0A4U6U5R3_SETVI|nr:hypothetical protein SEVIR_6G064550v2 [Setaria viridis]
MLIFFLLTASTTHPLLLHPSWRLPRPHRSAHQPSPPACLTIP